MGKPASSAANSPDDAITNGEDPLAEIDRIMKERQDDLQQSAERSARISAERSEFSLEFATVCEHRIRPAMEAILERLRRNGGGGIIDERPEDLGQHHSHRLTLWMSLNGEIKGTPRQDRHAYLQLDADVDERCVIVTEGDAPRGPGGTHSGRVGQWELEEITSARVTDEALAILRRSIGPPPVMGA